MKKLLELVKRPWFVSLLGVIALSVLIWFIGPLIAIAGHEPLASPLGRIVVILIIVLLWVLNILRLHLTVQKADKEIIDGMAETEQPGDVDAVQSEEEISTLKERFAEAVAVLKQKGRKGGGTRSLYELPWYIIIGPPGSGKTTALINSGMEFPLAERFGKEALRGVGGTRNCDWWFTNEAVFLDTAGRYTTQDSHAAVDSAAWEGFLGLLKKYRKRRPINGVVIAVSIADLMTQGEQERSAQVHAIKQRIQELNKQLGIRFPIYFLFTKCDLVSGFMEFYDDLDREARSQVWGTTLPLVEADENSLGHFDEEFDSLLQRLNDRLLWRMSQERDPQRRSLIYGFPQQMASLKEAVTGFIGELFRPSRFEEAPMLRGVYFTSGTQEGTPIDRLMGAASRTFGLDQQMLPSYGGHGRSYFITNLLKQVVFEEQDLVGTNRKLEKQRTWMQRTAYAMALLLTVGGVLGWTTSFTSNKNHIGEVNESVESYQALAATPLPADADFEDLLPRLDILLAATEFSRQHAESAPMHMKLGLYQGKALGDAASDAYLREMNSEFLTRIARRLEAQLSSERSDREFQYEALKVYLSLGNLEHLDPDLLMLWMSLDWQRQYGAEPDKQGRLQTHLTNLLADGVQPLELNQQLIGDVRLRLKQVSLAKLAYGRLVRDYNATDTMPFKPSDAMGPEGEKVFRRVSGKGFNESISGLFTYQGFYEIYLAESQRLADRIREERWVLGDETSELSQAELEHLEKNMLKLYLDDYIQVWDELLNDLQIIPFRSISHAAEVAAILSSPTSPLYQFLLAVERNTTLTKVPPGLTDQLAEKAAKLATEKNRLARLLQDTKTPVKAAPPGELVEEHFKDLNQLVKAEGGAPMVDRIVSMISDLYGYLDDVASGAGEGTMGVAKGTGEGTKVLRRIELASARQPQPMKTWLTQLSDHSRSVTLGDARAQLQSLLTSNVKAVCDSAITGRYPFDKLSERDVTLKDFGRTFGEGGVMDGFFQQHLKPFVDTSKSQWQWKKGKQASLGLSNRVLRQFQRAHKIKEAFFRDGGQSPLIRFALKPAQLDSRIGHFFIDIDGQQSSYRHGPVRVRNMQWPGAQSTNQVRVVFEDLEQLRHSRTKEGPWAFFRMLDQAQLESISSDRLAVTFEVNGYIAKYELQAGSVTHPFQTKELLEFRCPGGL